MLPYKNKYLVECHGWRSGMEQPHILDGHNTQILHWVRMNDLFCEQEKRNNLIADDS